jgi:anti-sigma factor RsiW
LADVDEEWLFDKISDARNMIAMKLEQKTQLQKRRNDCWYHLDEAECRLQSSLFEPEDRRQQWMRNAESWRNRHKNAREHVRNLKVSPSHGQIGRLLGIPTGTVSSGLHLLRKFVNDKNERS